MERPSTRIEKLLKLILHISAVTIVAGVFLPLADLPVNDEVTYNEIAATRSYFLVAFALVHACARSAEREPRRLRAACAALAVGLLPPLLFFGAHRALATATGAAQPA